MNRRQANCRIPAYSRLGLEIPITVFVVQILQLSLPRHAPYTPRVRMRVRSQVSNRR